MSKALRSVEFQVTVTFDGGSGIAVDVAMELTAREYTALVDCCAEGKEINQYWGLGKLSRRIETIAKEIYSADGVEFAPAADKQLAKITEMGYGNLPICMAKNQYSLSDDATLLGRPTNFKIHIREVYVNAGAGFVVALTGAIMTMPGLPKKPAAENIDVSDDGKITGLF